MALIFSRLVVCMRRLMALGVAGAGIVLLATAASGFEVQEVKSSGGITAWLVQDSTIPLIAVEFAFASGAEADKPGKEGTAHFLTGMMDEGAGDLDAASFQARRDDLSIRLSFSASSERFEGTLQTVAENRKEAFALLRRALMEPHFPEEAVERMRQNFLVNAQSDLNDPQTIASRELMRTLINDHPYTRFAKGTPESITAITRDDLVESHKAIFSKRGLKIAIVGDISPEELGLELDRTFGGLPDTAAPIAVPEISTVVTGVTKVIERDMPQSIIMFGAKGVKVDDPDFMAAFVMNEILGGDSNSWLSTEVREKRGLTYGIGLGLVPLKRGGLYMGSFSTINEKAGEAMEVVRQTIKRMADIGPTQQQLDEAKTYLTGSFALQFDSSVKVASYLLGQQLLNRDRDYVKKRNGRIEAVTLEQVKAQAKRLLMQDFAVVAIGKPAGLK